MSTKILSHPGHVIGGYVFPGQLDFKKINLKHILLLIRVVYIVLLLLLL